MHQQETQQHVRVWEHFAVPQFTEIKRVIAPQIQDAVYIAAASSLCVVWSSAIFVIVENVEIFDR